jgi:VanZ family protein
MTIKRNFVKYWIPVILWMSIIIWMSTETFSPEHTASVIEPFFRLIVPRTSPQQINFIHALLRKVSHVAEYFVLSLLLFRAFRGDSAASWHWRWSFLALVIVILSAFLDEFHQSLVPTRTSAITDVAIDMAGGGIAQLLTILWHTPGKK